MMRSLWTAATGMIAQQTNLDNISNNLANVNTTGFKRTTVEFKSLIYQTIQAKSTDSTGQPKPVGVQVGLGVRPGAITSSFVQGLLFESTGPFDCAIQGNGFFMAQLPDGSIGYTRNGRFNFSITENGMALTDSSGNPILSTTGEPIIIPQNFETEEIEMDQFGNLMYPDQNNNAQLIGYQIGLATFPNPAGLEKGGNSLLAESPASGVPTVSDAAGINSLIKSNYLEGSNVQAVDEMVNMIIAQRAYEMNSKAITASDQMLQQANNLRG
ncbi:MAG: flagellar basal-body rod protein FlgG [Lachnoclostridium sp.]|jgi:flagellar basal-body rod protein FlgG|nr:flagellar basal-body rod protein FlgG [Lachnoclostridium sp.]